MIEAKNISYKAGKFSLDDISFAVERGETLVVLGPTGAGKTVLLELLAGFRTPRNGEVLSDEKDITYVPPEKRKIGLLYQDYLLFPHLNVFENISYGLRARGVKTREAKKRVENMAEKIGIAHLLERKPRRLSGGEQQRVALARTLIVDPDILLLDEPFSSVDPKTKEHLMRELGKTLDESDMPVIYVTHDQVEAMEMADRIAVMNEGRIVQLDYPEGVYSAPKSEFVANFVGIGNIFRGKAARSDGGTTIDIDDVRICSSIDLEGDVHVTIRPEDIIVSREKISSSARNSLGGKVRAIVEKGPVVFVTADCGIEMTSAITRESLREMKITIGDEIFLTFKAQNVNLF